MISPSLPLPEQASNLTPALPNPTHSIAPNLPYQPETTSLIKFPPKWGENLNHRPVGSGKTALMLALCHALRDTYSLAAVTNDIFTREDAEFLTRHAALPPSRIRAIETGGCPHAAVREDISANLHELQGLHARFATDLLLIESGGDNLAANYSRELADFIIYVIDVAGGDKVPRKGGPGITGSDLLVVNKVDLAEAVGADMGVMERDAGRMRDGGPTVFAVVKHGKGVEDIVGLILSAWKGSGAYDVSMERWKKEGKKGSGGA